MKCLGGDIPLRRAGLGILAALVLMWGCAGTPVPKTGPETTPGRKKVQAAYEQMEQAYQQSQKAGEGHGPAEPEVDPSRVQQGDLVQVRVVLKSTYGTTFYDSDQPDAATRPGISPVGGYVLVGEKLTMKAVSEGLLGMQAGEMRTVRVPPEAAFGRSKETLIKRFPCFRRIPLTLSMRQEAFHRSFSRSPEVGMVVDLMPYLRHRVVAVEDAAVQLETVVPEQREIREPFGVARVTEQTQAIQISLEPRIGAPFLLQKKRGRITGSDGRSFTVDFNHPLAGKPLDVELTVQELIKADQVRQMTIDWNIDHDNGYALAENEAKPQVLVLYADWCQWSQRLLNFSLKDPRVTIFHDNFVWTKIDSSEEKAYKDYYEQDGYPSVLVLSPEGEILQRFDQFVDAATMSRALQKILGERMHSG